MSVWNLAGSLSCDKGPSRTRPPTLPSLNDCWRTCGYPFFPLFKPCSHCVSYPRGIQPRGGPGLFIYPTVSSAQFHIATLFHGVPAVRFTNIPGFYPLPLLQSRGGYSPVYVNLLGQTEGRLGLKDSKCPQIYIKLTEFEDNDSGKLPFKYY